MIEAEQHIKTRIPRRNRIKQPFKEERSSRRLITGDLFHHNQDKANLPGGTETLAVAGARQFAAPEVLLSCYNHEFTTTQDAEEAGNEGQTFSPARESPPLAPPRAPPALFSRSAARLQCSLQMTRP